MVHPRIAVDAAVLAGLRVPFVCTETHEMGEEILASYLYQVHLYQWLEKNGFGSALGQASSRIGTEIAPAG